MNARVRRAALAVVTSWSLVPAGCGDVIVDKGGVVTGTGAGGAGASPTGGTGAVGTGGLGTGAVGTGGLGTGGVGAGGVGTGGTGGADVQVIITATPSMKGPCYANPMLLPPDPLFLIVASGPISCADTVPPLFDQSCPGGGLLDFAWELCIPFPAPALTAGTLPVPGPGTSGYTYAKGGAFSCQKESNFMGAGSISFSTPSAGQVWVSITGAEYLISSGNIEIGADGTRLATLCP